MNNLISHNPITRFRQRIKKFQNPDSPLEFNYLQGRYNWNAPINLGTATQPIWGGTRSESGTINLPNITVRGNKSKARENRIKSSKNQTIANLQNALYEIGAYDKGITWHDAVDGINGKGTKKAIQRAKSMGYDVDESNGTIRKPTPINQSRSTNNVLSSALNVGKNIIGQIIPIIPLSYAGTEEEARKLGYKTYGLTGKPVDYGVAPEDSTSARTIAGAQMKKYRITSQQTQDKSKLHNMLYEYMPTNGYDVLMMAEGMVRKDKNADSKTGKAVRGEKKRPVTEIIEKALGSIYDFVTGSSDGTERAQKNKSYNRNSTSKREDLRNLMMGYPIVNGTIEISPYVMGKGRTQDGFTYRFKDRAPLQEVRSANLQPGEHRQIADGYDMGSHGISRSADGKTQAYYDYWDINPLTVIPGVRVVTDKVFPKGMVGRGFDLYDRIDE